MDYKYINQLLERYWQGETSLEEEQILRAFFSQVSIPEDLEQYRCLFIYEQTEPQQDVLGDDFDARLLKAVGEEEPHKARRISLSQRLAPLFRAVAIVAIVLTLGNAASISYNGGEAEEFAATPQQQPETSVAQRDTASTDTLRQHGPDVALQQEGLILNP